MNKPLNEDGPMFGTGESPPRSDVQGQWYINSLLRQYCSELECYKLIDAEHARIFRASLKRQQLARRQSKEKGAR